MASAALDKLRALLNELFLLDDPDLDFGLYRVMNARRREVEHFRDKELEGAVSRALAQAQNLDRAALEEKLKAARAGAATLGLNDEQAEATPKVVELKAQIQLAENVTNISDEVFAHLYSFFQRYYQSGDFHCRRQFRDGVYAIPYQGEEVRLFWANADQYYIKTTQRLARYEFVLPGEARRVRFEVVGGTEERDNTKAARVFQLAPGDPFVKEGAQLTVRFIYAPDPHGANQDAHALKVAEAVEARKDLTDWSVHLLAVENGKGTRLARHLQRFTRRETFDYFIHQDLGRFLRQELDYYLKTEVMRLDDVVRMEGPRVEEYVSKLRVLRTLGHAIIDFVAQLEDFQKRLWLKRKFVLGNHWLVSLGLVPRTLWPAVRENRKQREAWVKWLRVDAIKNELFPEEGYTEALTDRFLELHPTLVVDTSLFDADFTASLLAELGDLDAKTLGLLVHGENFQALNLLQERFRGKVKCIYIDPPYNTGGDGFAYKDNYQHSSWLAMMIDRVRAGRDLLGQTGSMFVSIDDIEVGLARFVADLVFGDSNRIETFIWKKSYGGGPKEKFAVTLHEYILQYAADAQNLPNLWLPPNEETAKRYYKYSDSKVATRGPYRLQPLEAAKSMDDRENLRFSIKFPDGTIVNPKRQWLWREDRVKDAVANDELVLSKGDDGDFIVNYKQYLLDEEGQQRGAKPVSIIENLYGPQGTARLDDLFGSSPFAFPKPTGLLKLLIQIAVPTGNEGWVADYFAGSGTIADAVMAVSDADGTRRRFLLVEQGEEFNTVLKPRVMKVMHAREWKDGVPLKREGTQGVVQVLRLESYDDTLDNLQSTITEMQQGALFDAHGLTAFGREYLLRYMLDHSTHGSASLLDARALEQPFDRQLRVTIDGDTQTRAVDVPETFHWLMGMTVTQRDRTASPEVRVSWGTLPDGRRAVTVWRDVTSLHGEALETWFLTHLRPRLTQVEVVYVNGDQQWDKFRPAEHRWEVRRSEHEFVERMFPAQG